MRRPLFLFFIGLVLGEAAAIFLNRIGFFVMALFLLIFMIFCFIFYRKVRREQSLFFIYEVLCWFFFLMGGIAFFRASYFNEIDRILSKKTLTGTLIGQVEYVRQNAEGEYQITVRENSFVVNENHLKDGIKKNLKKCSISSIKSNLRQTKKLPGKCRLVKIPVSKGKIYPGDFITCTGKLKAIEEQTNPGEFNTKIYYYSVGIRYQFFGENLTRKRESPLSLHRIAGSVRERIDAIYRHILSDTEYALLKAIFLGDKTDLSKEQKHLYEENGMAHLLAVSGVKTLKLDIPLVPETRINWAFMPLHIVIIYILKLCLDEEIIPRCRFPCSRGYFKKCINYQKKQLFSVSQSYCKSLINQQKEKKPMAYKKYRGMKVYEASGYQYKRTPSIVLKGQWLSELGFDIGEQIEVKCEDGRLIITKANEIWT